MNLQLFFESFEAIAEAPGGVQKLQSLILDWAVREKLVPQDAKDESAEVLYEKLIEEKTPS
jgi:type I restriction enzyme, S subunit